MKLIIQNIYEKHKKRKGRQGKKYIYAGIEWQKMKNGKK